MKSELYELTENEIEEFDNLFDGNISEEEYYILKAKIQLDEVLQHKYLLYKMLRLEIEQDGLANTVLKSRLKVLDKATNKRYHFILYSSLLALCMLVGGLFVLFYGFNKNNEIYNQYKDSEAGLSIKMSMEKTINLNSAMVNLANGKFELAMQDFSKVDQNDTTTFYIGYCHEKLNNDLLAISQYEKLFNSKSKLIHDKSVFRLSLLYLKTGDKRTKQMLQAIINDSSNLYHEAAIEIVSSMGK
jgi:hypothetical protein